MNESYPDLLRTFKSQPAILCVRLYQEVNTWKITSWKYHNRKLCINKVSMLKISIPNKILN